MNARQLEIDSELTSSSEAIAKQIAQVQADLATLRRNNKEIETKLRQRKRRIEAQVEDIIFQYDQVCRWFLVVLPRTAPDTCTGDKPESSGPPVSSQ